MNKKRIEIPLYLKRTNYFQGQILTAADFQTEQNYFRERMRLHNVNCHGIGIVSGLEVTPTGGPGKSIIVSPGTALDPVGNEITLSSPVRCPLPQKCEMAFLVLYWTERGTDAVPGLTPEGDTELTIYSKVEEYAILKYETDEERARIHAGVILARLIKIRRKWKVDEEFHVQRAKA